MEFILWETTVQLVSIPSQYSENGFHFVGTLLSKPRLVFSSGPAPTSSCAVPPGSLPLPHGWLRYSAGMAACAAELQVYQIHSWSAHSFQSSTVGSVYILFVLGMIWVAQACRTAVGMQLGLHAIKNELPTL